jgi:transcription antitermination factor NusG
VATYWGVVYLHQVELALDQLARIGIELYTPRVLERRIVRGRRVVRTSLLFGRYTFFRVTDQWHHARRCPGVVEVVRCTRESAPSRVSDILIASLKASEKAGLVVLPRQSRLKPGDRVRVTGGLLEGQIGILAGLDGRDRATILLGALRAVVPQAGIELAR